MLGLAFLPAMQAVATGEPGHGAFDGPPVAARPLRRTRFPLPTMRWLREFIDANADWLTVFQLPTSGRRGRGTHQQLTRPRPRHHLFKFSNDQLTM